MTLAQRDAAELALIVSIEQSILAALTLPQIVTASDLHAFVRRDVGEQAEQGLIRGAVLRLLNAGRIEPGRNGIPALVEDAAPWLVPQGDQRRSRLSPLAGQRLLAGSVA